MNTTTEPISRARLATAALALGALWFVLCRQLSGEWSVNEQYSYGWFVPFFAAFLFWLRWEDRPEPRMGNSERGTRNVTAIAVAVGALVVLFPVRLFEVANPDWRPVDWVHTAAVITLTLLVIWMAGGKPWLRHFAFPVCFFFVAVPWITPIEEPIVQSLMRAVATVATETITLFGIPAQLEGNLIRVSTGLVGVNEACSGVRSLQTSLMIGLLFGELKRLSGARRCVLVLGTVAIAVTANFGRAFFLVWMAATRGTAAVEAWHDFAGYTIVAIVFLGSLGLAAWLGKGERRKAERGEQKSTPAFIPRPSFFILCFAWLVAVELGVEAWYRGHERGLVMRERWTARWPEKASGFHDIHLDERTRRILRCDEGRGAMWRVAVEQKTEVGGQKEDAALLYFFRWKAGSNSALLANVHRPDICLPASGWTQIGDYGLRSYRISENFSLPFRHFVFSQIVSGTDSSALRRYAHAFYCLREDRVRRADEDSLAHEQFAQEPSEWSRRERLDLVAQGRRHLGQQVMEFVLISAREAPPEDAERTFGALLPGIVEEK